MLDSRWFTGFMTTCLWCSDWPFLSGPESLLMETQEEEFIMFLSALWHMHFTEWDVFMCRVVTVSCVSHLCCIHWPMKLWGVTKHEKRIRLTQNNLFICCRFSALFMFVWRMFLACPAIIIITLEVWSFVFITCCHERQAVMKWSVLFICLTFSKTFP